MHGRVPDRCWPHPASSVIRRGLVDPPDQKGRAGSQDQRGGEQSVESHEFEAPDAPGRPAQAFALEQQHAHNFELWLKESGGMQGSDAVVVIEKKNPHKLHSRMVKKYDKYHRMLDPLFEEVKPEPSLVAYEDGKIERFWGTTVERPAIREFMIFRCYGFRGQMIVK